jgi:hypothetical protein
LEYGANQILVLPGETSEEDCYLAALLCRKHALDWAVEVVGPVQAGEFAQAKSFRRQTLLNFTILLDLDESRGHCSSGNVESNSVDCGLVPVTVNEYRELRCGFWPGVKVLREAASHALKPMQRPTCLGLLLLFQQSAHEKERGRGLDN